MAEIVLKTSAHHPPEPPLELDELDEQDLDRQIQELGIKVAEGPAAKEDRKELYMLLNQILSYPSTEQAENHRTANRLGQLDLNQEERYQKISDRVFLLSARIRFGARNNSSICASAAGSSCRASPFPSARIHWKASIT